MKNKVIIHITHSTQKGIVLFIALVVLVAMTLAGLALWRSVDAGNVIAGNLAFKQSSIMSADRGVQAAVTWMDANRASLYETNLGNGYYSNVLSVDPDWNSANAWESAVDVGKDAAGNRVKYLIHRLCTVSGVAYNHSTNVCSTSLSTTPATNANMGSSMTNDANIFLPTPSVYYRITVLVNGPRNTTSVIQSVVLVPV
ncbi:hypothetical protein LG201_12085 [Methylobacillus gramineus]|uniref:pilus assembly PilX family protein n=1 Tax=Methylobacillus gramineus TaxID=755169 RepID=UPI001CFFFB28|nr:hypothetical protein [Methylobacillus gramineus]MCB5185943.1 hypothetical protein [Methylobacillus gramineus]